jgi:hypothetical protein
LPGKRLAPRRTARARKGVPIGAGLFGRVRTRDARGPAADLDLDGVPAPLDVDDDGDLVLDKLDSSTAPRAAQTTVEIFDLHTGLDLPIYDTANANAPGLTDQQIEAALPTFGTLILEVLPGSSAELDCGGLVYCSSGGTGRVPQNLNPPTGPPFPACCDADGDGFGTLTPAPGLPPPASGMFLLHGATSAQIGTGDVLIERVTSGDPPVESEFPATLQFVFATVPALVSYSDGQGNSGTVSYPVAGPYTGPPEGYRPPGPGAKGNGFPVAAGPDGNVVLTLTYWRPQRRPIPGEPGYGVPGAWTDMGGLTYTAGIADLAISCPKDAFLSVDPQLAPSPTPGAIGLIDLAPDGPSSPTNTFTLTLNVTRCLASQGVSWDPGQEHDLHFGARDSAFDQAGQAVSFKRP